MKKIFVILCFFSVLLVNAQTLEIDTLLYNGDLGTHINLVVLGDGYVQSELDQFSDDAQDFTDYLFSQKPYDSYRNFFNAFAVRVPSNESGANHPGTATDVNEPVFPVKTVDNVFGSTFDGWGIHRLLVLNNINAVYSVLADNFPLFDQVIVLVNSEEYGGSGGQFAVSSLNTSANEIAVHEMGHSFVSLIDEYYAGDQYAREGLNMTAETDPSKVRWKNWVGYKQVGIYQHCCGGESNNWYRPHENCKMRVLGPEFCPVCIEATIERIHQIAPILQDMSPKEAVVDIMDSLRFNIDLKKPDPNTLNVQWILNEDTIASGLDELVLKVDDFSEVSNELIVTVEDVSSYLRVDNHSSLHTEIAIWEVVNNTTNTFDISAKKEQLHVNISPNPFQEVIAISFDKLPSFPVSAQVYDLKGQLIHSFGYIQGNDVYLDTSTWESGTYFVSFKKENQVLASRKIVKH